MSGPNRTLGTPQIAMAAIQRHPYETPPLPDPAPGHRRPSASRGGSRPRGDKTFSRRSRHGQIAVEIGMRIVRGDLPPGTVLPNEADLSDQFSVSRTALREAIKVLAAKGLVESRPKTGTKVRPRDEWNLLDPDLLSWQFATQPVERLAKDLFEIRLIVEPAAAAMAAERATEPQRDIIRQALADMALAPDGEASIEPDLRFHQSILAASNNEFLQPLGSLIETAMATSFQLTNNVPGALQGSVPLHQAVYDAIAAQEPEKAREAMRILLDGALDDVFRAIASRARIS